jgi:hypothetical protein
LPSSSWEQNFYGIEMYRPDVYQAIAATIAQNYRATEISPTALKCLPH